MAALQLLAIAGYCASLRLALHHHKHTLHPVQLIFLGSRYREMRHASDYVMDRIDAAIVEKHG
jgi:hypothetical protein